MATKRVTQSVSSDEGLQQLLRRVSETPSVLALRRPIHAGSELADGRFRITAELGEGGMGRVFGAVDQATQRAVAVKVIGRMTPQAIVQLKREFRIASELIHPHIVRLHELFRDGMEWFFTMELVRGALLPELVLRTPVAERHDLVRAVAKQLARALRAVHEFGAVHGDLKPFNFLVEESDSGLRVVLLDFGLARPFGHTDGGGTYVYMAPEQLVGDPVTEAVDWYALGVVLHEALTGKLPRPGFGVPVLEGIPPDLQALCRALLAPLPGDRPTADEVLAILGESDPPSGSFSLPPRSRLVGREREIAKFQEHREKHSGTAPSMVLVHGPSGMGKTALVEHLVQMERTAGALVLRGRCRENESIGYKAIDGLVDDLVTVLSELTELEGRQVLPKAAAELVQLFPALRGSAVFSRVATAEAERGDQALVRQRAIGAFSELLRRLGAFGQLILWIDDLQWSDVESALVLGPALGGLEPVPMLLIGSHRSGEPVPMLEALAADTTISLPEQTTIALGALTEADAEEMALDLLRSDPQYADRRAREIVRDAAGLPLFITELAHTRNSSPPPVDAEGLTLRSVVTQRVRELPPAARGVVEFVAIAGTPVSRGLIRKAQRLDPADLEDAITLLRANRLVLTGGLRDEHTVDIRHDRLREVVTHDLGEETSRRHHLSLALALETNGGKPEEIATHYQGAGELARAGRHWLAAADDSAKALAFHKAADFFRRALKRATLDASERHAVELRLAEMLAYAGEGAAAAEAYLDVARRSPRDEAIELRRRAAEQLLLSGRIPAGLEVLEDVLTATRMPRSRGGRGAIPSVLMGRLRIRARGLGFRLRTENELSREELARLDVAWTIACSMGFVDYIRGADFQNRHLLLALEAGEPRRLVRALALEALNSAAPSRASRTRTAELLRISESLVDETPDRQMALGLVSLARGVAAYLHGDTDRAVTHCGEAEHILTTRCTGAVWERVTAQRFLIASLFYAGQFRRLGEVVPPLLAQAEGTANLYAKQFYRSGYSIASWLIRDEVEEARRQIRHAESEWRSQSYQLPEYNRLLSEAYVELYAGEWERATALVSSHWRQIERAQLLRIAIVKVQVWQLRGAGAVGAARAALERGDRATADRFTADAERCAAVIRGDELPRARPLAALLEGAIDLMKGARGEAARKLESAANDFDVQGMQLFAAAARLRLGELDAGSVGRALVREARDRFDAQGVVNHSKMAGMLAPGFATTDVS